MDSQTTITMIINYEYENIKTGERRVERRELGDTKPKRGWIRVFSSDIAKGPNGTVRGR